MSEINDLDDIDISDKPSTNVSKDFLLNSASNLSDDPIKLDIETPLEEIKTEGPSLTGNLGKTQSDDGFKVYGNTC